MTAFADSPAAPRAGVLRDRSLLRFFLGQGVSSFGDHVLPIAVAVWVVSERQDGPAALGALFAARTVATAVLLVVGGVFSDRLDRRALLVGAQIALGVIVGAIALIPKDTTFVVVLALFTATGAVDAFFRPAYAAYVFDLAGSARLEAANSISTLTLRCSGLLGPAVGGLLVATIGVRPTLLLDALTFAVGVICVASTRIPATSAPAGAEPGKRLLGREVKEGFAIVRRTRWLQAVLLSDLSQTFVAVAPWIVLLPIVLLPHGTAGYGFTLAAFAAGGIAGAATPLRWRPFATGRAALLSQALFVVPLAALAFDVPLSALIAAAFVGGYGVDLGAVLFVTGLQRGVPQQTLGRVMALSEIGSVALMPAGFALAGILVRPLGAPALLAAGAVTVVLATTAALRTTGVATMGQGG